MLKLDNNLLNDLGLGSLPEDQKKAMLQHIYETLELRVGTQLANQMTDQQLEEFERFIDGGGDANQAQALQWLESNLPNYKQVVNDVFESLKSEIAQMAPQIVASSQQAQPTQPIQSGQPAQLDPYAQPDQFAQPQQPAAQQAYQTPPQQYQAPQPAYQQPAAVPQQQPYAPAQSQPQQPQYGYADPSQQQQAPAFPQYPPQQPPAGPSQPA